MKIKMEWCLVVILWASCNAHGASCEAVHNELAAISLELSHGNTRVADSIGPLAATYPGCSALLLATARAQALANDSQATGTFSHYTDLEPEDASGYGFYARYLLTQGEYQRADMLASLGLGKDPANPISLAVSGQILGMKGNANDGIAMLLRACALEPEDAESHFQLGALYDRIKQPGNAVEHFRSTVDLNSSDARAWDYLALNLEPLGQVDRAEVAYKKGLDVNQRGPFYDGFLDYNYGRFLMKRGDLSGAKEHLDRATGLAPKVRAVWYERAKLNLKMKSYPEARTDAEMAESLPDRGGIIINLQIYSLLEQIYRRLGETALADKYAQMSRETLSPVRKSDR